MAIDPKGSMAFDSLSPQLAVKKWNESFPVGTPVRYWAGARVGRGSQSKTRTPAEVLFGHTAVVWLDGVSGCLALSHVQPEPVSKEIPKRFQAVAPKERLPD